MTNTTCFDLGTVELEEDGEGTGEGDGEGAGYGAGEGSGAGEGDVGEGIGDGEREGAGFGAATGCEGLTACEGAAESTAPQPENGMTAEHSRIISAIDISDWNLIGAS